VFQLNCLQKYIGDQTAVNDILTIIILTLYIVHTFSVMMLI
jgi:hypothetical protein